MAVVTVEGIGAHAGATVTLRGWLALRRSSGKLHFLQVRDGTGCSKRASRSTTSPARRSRGTWICGSVPHAGFGMGIERCVAWLCGLHHVRETIPFPRILERLRP